MQACCQKLSPAHLWDCREGLPDPTDRWMQYSLSVDVKAAPLLSSGEMNVVWLRQGVRADAISFQVLLSRRSVIYLFEFLIQAALVIAGGAALFVPFGDSILVDRSSVLLAVLLTLVIFTLERPASIDGVPYATLQDKIEQCFVVVGILTGLECFVVSQLCYGQFGPDPIFYGGSLKFDSEGQSLYPVSGELPDGATNQVEDLGDGYYFEEQDPILHFSWCDQAPENSSLRNLCGCSRGLLRVHLDFRRVGCGDLLDYVFHAD